MQSQPATQTEIEILVETSIESEVQKDQQSEAMGEAIGLRSKGAKEYQKPMRDGNIGSKGQNAIRKQKLLIAVVLIIILIGLGLAKVFYRRKIDYPFCLVAVVRDQNRQNWQAHFSRLKELQNFIWQGFYYVQEPQAASEWMVSQFQKESLKVRFMNSSGNRGRDHYDALQNRCPYYSIVMLVRQDEQLLDVATILQNIRQQARAQKPHHVWIYPYIDENGVQHKPHSELKENSKYFSRQIHFTNEYDQTKTVTQKYDEKQPLFQAILHQVRIFKREFFSYIGYFDLMDHEENFYSSELAFLFPLVEMSNRLIPPSIYISKLDIYFPGVPRANNYMPLFRKLSSKSYVKEASEKQKAEVMKICFKMGYQDTVYFFDDINPYDRRVRPWSKYPRFNVLKRNITQENKIPKIVHQVWATTLRYGNTNTEIPYFKQKFISKVREVYSHYEYKLWTNDNITEQNFPKTYKYIKQLYEIDKTFQYSRMSMVSDFVRIEALYKYGGFYLDTNVQPFRPMDDLLKYQFVAFTEQMPRWTEYFATGVMGSQKGSRFLAKILTDESLSQINLKGFAPSAGPGYVPLAFDGDDFLSLKIVPSSETYPFMYYVIDKRYHPDRCAFIDEIPQNLKGTYDEVIEMKYGKMIFPCASRYPGKYAVDHLSQGITWRAISNNY